MKERSEAATATNLIDNVVVEIRFHLDSRRGGMLRIQRLREKAEGHDTNIVHRLAEVGY